MAAQLVEFGDALKKTAAVCGGFGAERGWTFEVENATAGEKSDLRRFACACCYRLQTAAASVPLLRCALALAAAKFAHRDLAGNVLNNVTGDPALQLEICLRCLMP